MSRGASHPAPRLQMISEGGIQGGFFLEEIGLPEHRDLSWAIEKRKGG